MNEAANRLSKVLPFVLCLAALLFMLLSARVLIRNIGVFHDELWDAIPAAAMIRAEPRLAAQELQIGGYPLPLVTGPYQGALKTWVLAPLMLLLGSSPALLRALNVLFCMIYLAVLYRALLPVVDRTWASLIFLAPLLDTNLLITAPMDMGPMLFQCIFASLTAGALFHYMSSSRLKHCWLAWFFCGCTLAQKLTSVPIVISISIAVCVLSCRHFLRTVRETGLVRAAGSFIVIPSILFLVPLLPHIVYFLKSGLRPLQEMTSEGVQISYLTEMGHNISFWFIMFGGVDWYQRITGISGFDMVAISPLAVFGVAAMAVSTWFCLLSRKERRVCRPPLACISLAVLSFSLFPCFRGLHRPWHFYPLAPLFLCCCVVCTKHCVSFLAAKSPRFATAIKVVLIVGLAACIIQGAFHGTRILRRIETHKGVCISSPSIMDLYRSIVALRLKTVYTFNYSLAYPIYVLSNGKIRVEELVWEPLTREKIDELFARIQADSGSGIVYRNCGSKEVDRERVGWYNREPEAFQFISRVETGKDNLAVVRHRDLRETEFVLVHRGDRESAHSDGADDR